MEIRWVVHPEYQFDQAEGWYYAGAAKTLQVKIAGEWSDVPEHMEWRDPPGAHCKDNLPSRRSWVGR